MNYSFNKAIEQKNPLNIATAIQAITIVVPLFDKIFGGGKAAKKNAQLMRLIQNFPDGEPIHLLQDAAKIINEG